MQQAGQNCSASTTDGCMGVFEVTDNRQVPPKSMPAFADLIPEYGQITQRYLAIKAMQQGRINLGLDPRGWIEAKHIGDEYEVFKTRKYFLAQDGKRHSLPRADTKSMACPMTSRMSWKSFLPKTNPPCFASVA